MFNALRHTFIDPTPPPSAAVAFAARVASEPDDDPFTPLEAARAFALWLRAIEDRQDRYTDRQLSSLYMVWCEAHPSRIPAAENMMRGKLRTLPGIKRDTVNGKTRDGKRRRSVRWTIGEVPPQRKRKAS